MENGGAPVMETKASREFAQYMEDAVSERLYERMRRDRPAELEGVARNRVSRLMSFARAWAALHEELGRQPRREDFAAHHGTSIATVNRNCADMRRWLDMGPEDFERLL